LLDSTKLRKVETYPQPYTNYRSSIGLSKRQTIDSCVEFTDEKSQMATNLASSQISRFDTMTSGKGEDRDVGVSYYTKLQSLRSSRRDTLKSLGDRRTFEALGGFNIKK